MNKRSRKGGGTVFWDEDRGRYTGQISYYDAAGKRKRPKVHAATEAACWEKLDELRAEVKTTGSVAPRDLTMADMINDLLAHPPAKWKSPLTLIGRKNHAARINGALGKVKVSRLTVAQVEQFLERTAADGLSADTLRRLRSMLRLAIRRAERDGKVSRNVAALADVPAGTRRQSRSMTLEEIRALLGLKLNAWWRAYIVTALMTGLRPGELLGLRWEDVDFAAGVIRVRKCLKALPDPAAGKRRLVVEDLKTERSRRTIQMPRQVVTTLLALRKEQTALRLKLGAAYDVRGLAVVFGDRAGHRDGPRMSAVTPRSCAAGRASARTGRRASSATRSCRCCQIQGWTSSRSPMPSGTSTRR